MLEEQEAAGGSRQKAFGFRKGMVRIGRSPDPVEGGGNAAENVGTITKVIDPQLDNNLLSALANPNDPLHAAAVEYANANKAAGLSVNRSAYQEFLKTYSKDQFAALKEQYGMKLIREIPLEELQSTATRLQAAFTDGRVLADADARVAASALLKGEKLATNDLQFFKRAKDLGLNVEYVGSGDAAAKAAAYVPKPVTIPSP
jgi:predicted nucleic acid-binding protein